jgi:hypothetical protein
MLFVLQFADASEAVGMLMFSQQLLLPLLFSIPTACHETCVAAAIAVSIDDAVC